VKPEELIYSSLFVPKSEYKYVFFCDLCGCQGTVHEDYLQACDAVLSGGYVGKFGEARCPRP